MALERNYGLAALQRGEYEAAINYLERAREQNPNDFRVLLYLGGAYHQTKRDAEAADALARAVALQPDNAHAHYNLGISLDRLHRREEAIAAVLHALELQPDYALARGVLRKWQKADVLSPIPPLLTTETPAPPQALPENEAPPSEEAASAGDEGALTTALQEAAASQEQVTFPQAEEMAPLQEDSLMQEEASASKEQGVVPQAEAEASPREEAGLSAEEIDAPQSSQSFSEQSSTLLEEASSPPGEEALSSRQETPAVAEEAGSAPAQEQPPALTAAITVQPMEETQSVTTEHRSRRKSASGQRDGKSSRRKSGRSEPATSLPASPSEARHAPLTSTPVEMPAQEEILTPQERVAPQREEGSASFLMEAPAPAGEALISPKEEIALPLSEESAPLQQEDGLPLEEAASAEDERALTVTLPEEASASQEEITLPQVEAVTPLQEEGLLQEEASDSRSFTEPPEPVESARDAEPEQKTPSNLRASSKNARSGRRLPGYLLKAVKAAKNAPVAAEQVDPAPRKEATAVLRLAICSLLPIGFLLGPLAIGKAMGLRRWILSHPYWSGSRLVYAAIVIGAVGTVLSWVELCYMVIMLAGS